MGASIEFCYLLIRVNKLILDYDNVGTNILTSEQLFQNVENIFLGYFTKEINPLLSIWEKRSKMVAPLGDLVGSVVKPKPHAKIRPRNPLVIGIRYTNKHLIKSMQLLPKMSFWATPTFQ